MRKLLIFILLIIIPCLTVLAYDEVEVEPIPMIGEAPCSFDMYIDLLNDDTIKSATMGFKIWATEIAVFDIVDISVIPGSRADGALPWEFTYGGEYHDTILIKSGPLQPGIYDGVPPGADKAFKITFDITGMGEDWGPDTGFIFIDTCALVPPDNEWGWNYTIPPFNDGHSYIVVLGFVAAGRVFFNVTPDDDVLIGDHCTGVQFQFETSSMFYNISGYSVCFDVLNAEITNDGLFTYFPDDPGLYNISVQSYDDDVPPKFQHYKFDVILTNDGLTYDNCPSIPIITGPGLTASYNLGLNNFDCDPIMEVVNLTTSPYGSDPVNNPTMENGVINWMVDEADSGFWVFDIVGSDPYGEESSCQIEVNVIPGLALCGDANADKTVNVSDAVLIINYVFVGGDPPNPLSAGDANCDGSVGVSDAVWIINYVFVGGNLPCDQNDDGIIDCYK